MAAVLVVDDEERLRTFLSRAMTTEGHAVQTAVDGTEAVEAAGAQRFDLVLLDLVMPGMNGLDALTRLRQLDAATPVVVLSGVTDVSSRVEAFERGAVDFVSKPFHVAELLARTRRHLAARDEPARRTGDDRFLEAGPVRLDLDRRRARTRSGETALAEREFALLAHLMRRQGRVCRRDELLHDVWGLDFDPGSNVIEVAVGRLRSKVSDLPLETVRGVGYCYYGD